MLFLSAAIVMAARILSRLENDKKQGEGKQKIQQMFFHHVLLTAAFTHNFQLIHHVSSLPLYLGLDIYLACFCNQSDGSPFICIISAKSNFESSVLVAKTTLDKKRLFCADVIRCQSSCSRMMYLSEPVRVQIIADCKSNVQIHLLKR